MTMANEFLLLPVLVPLLAAAGLLIPALRRPRALRAYVLASVCLESALILGAILFPPDAPLVLFSLAESLRFTLFSDGLTRVFAAILAVLWPLTTVYAFDYLKEDAHKPRFFTFFLIAYAVSTGVAFAGNIATLYLFFELLTLSTLPLVMHRMDDQARYAGRKYLLYSMTGASLGFIALVFSAGYGALDTFAMGGVLDAAKAAGHEPLLQTVFTVAFFGFGVKAALLPMSAWLPAASVAPTPVTALLHAVAVVKAGAFACIRLTYYTFGTSLLAGSAAQDVVLTAAAVTIAFGSAMALRSNHLKRRLAWSTVSNLSYILLGCAVMTGASLVAAAMHMIYHAFIKITLFFGVGAVMERAGKNYLDEIDGLAARMPLTVACFTLASLALMGLPPLPGFFSKWALGVSAAEAGTPVGLIGVGALILSALLTALYLLQIVARAYRPLPAQEAKRIETAGMTVPMCILGGCIVLMGLCSGQIQKLLTQLLF